MKKQPKHTAESVLSALRFTGPYPYQCKSCDPKYDAQGNLTGRTHYVDDSTLRAFGARIVTAYSTDNGLLFGLVESVSKRPDHGGYTKRVVVFDIWGSVVNDRAGMDGGTWYRETKQADKVLAEFLKTFDAVKHTRQKAQGNARRAIADSKALLAALR